MAVHWTIPFRSLRTNILYTVNIYDSTYSGNPIPLKGGAQPFVTQENDDEDGFIPIRTQSGYLRIVDDGYAADGTTAFNWKQLLPMTDTDRPVTLTNGDGDIVWQGFMQAQNFSGTLYGNPQEREFPVQCALTILEGTDINYQQTEIKNFAYLLNYIISSIPTISITTIKVQGNTDAQSWLLKCIDWQNFVSEDNDGNPSARFNLYQCLEDMCRFWGWTARTFGTTLYLTCADDPDEQQWLTLTRAQLETMAGGTTAGTTGGSFITLALSGDIFASTNQDDYRQRGPNKATVKADANGANEDIIDFGDSSLVEKMEDQGWRNPSVMPSGKYVAYTNDLLSYSDTFISGSAESGKSSFNVMRVNDSLRDPNGTEMPVIRILKSYNGSSYVSLESIYEHSLADGYMSFNGKIYRQGEEFKDYDDESSMVGHEIGNKTMYIRLGIGKDRNSASWFNGRTWSSTVSTIKLTIGNADTIFRNIVSSGSFSGINNSIHIDNDLKGRLFIDMLGSDDLDDIDGQKGFEITDFNVKFSFQSYRVVNLPSSITRSNRKDIREYKSTNGNNVREEFNSDCIYASDNNMSFGYGVLLNPDGSRMGALLYNGGSVPQFHEQHIADRVTSYWANAKRRLAVDLRSNGTNVNSVRPDTKVTLDSTTLFPIAFGREWRDDITILTLLEL